MVSNGVEKKFAMAVMSCRAASVPAWEQFIAALADYLEEITEELVSSPSERLPEMQGRAREIRDLFKLLAKSPQLAQQLYDKERANAHTNRKP